MTQTTLEPQISHATCASCPYFQAHNDGTNKGWCGLFDHFTRESHLQTADCVNSIRDEQETEAQAEIEELPEPYEIDSEKDAEFGELFRLWKGWQFAGSFYKARDGKWIAQPIKATINGRLNTSTQAILILITIFENPELQTAA